MREKGTIESESEWASGVQSHEKVMREIIGGEGGRESDGRDERYEL